MSSLVFLLLALLAGVGALLAVFSGLYLFASAYVQWRQGPPAAMSDREVADALRLTNEVMGTPEHPLVDSYDHTARE